MKKLSVILIFSFFIASIWACDQKKPIINEGTIKVAIDESLVPISEALIQSYKIHYPKTNFTTVVVPESKAIKMLFDDSVSLAITTRGYNAEELRVMKSREVKYIPAICGIDAVMLVTSKNYPDTAISQEKLKYMLSNPDSKTKLIFDKAASSNYNTIIEKLKVKNVNLKNVYAAEGNLQVLQEVQKHPDAIGFLGYNWVSDEDDYESQKLINNIKILAVSDSTGKNFAKATWKNIDKRIYPFDRFVYMHTMSKSWGVENGFIRFTCAKTGQFVIEKMGLIPYYLIPKEFYLEKKPL
ncbi:MAG: substrate-binding domain-containing protein [Spirosomataceae bacterium]|jgi:phosphate transport system substrate-binding protein